MEIRETTNQAVGLRFLPSVDEILRSQTAQILLPEVGAKYLAVLARSVIDRLRLELQENSTEEAATAQHFSREDLFEESEKRLKEAWQSSRSTRLRRVINATGVVIHTNLGRAPLSEEARKAVFEKASGYCTLEYNLETGQRGRRGDYAEQLLAELTGAESALIVNNCAAATILVLTTLAKGGEAIISRGELVEIGGDFRIPDVMEQSGAILKEVGATNRTRISDYEKAIDENTRLILKVHPSNYRIIGFTQMPDLAELTELAHHNKILLFEDAGSGAMFDLSKYNLEGEPVISQSIAKGADVVTFSGDKLLGGVQSGLIVGRREVIERLRKHPLYRALRVDKMIYAALEATLEIYRRETTSEEIPIWQMLSMPEVEIKERIENFAQNLHQKRGENHFLHSAIIEGNSVIGGGSAPMTHLKTTLLALVHEKMSAAKLEKELRLSKPAIITRILEDKVLIDLRTVSESEEVELSEVLEKI
ncbi:MAG: L-seryl-tRNA(Sec) selenium transferase [Acidobacteriota bacterium]|jgi:L-seryl-tRNA(Ser) seleniumtransferase|nr:L-seryl-tRNA(Sec) selenium transferase [Acidobacteriota bacterium]